MLPPELLKKAEMDMRICNACRYCEGFCAVFDALERRKDFAAHDLVYLANVCFDCRACFHACQYTPPHEFAINLPKTFSELRAASYEEYSAPRVLGRLLRRPGWTMAVAVVFGATLVRALVSATDGTAALSEVGVGEGAFYRPLSSTVMTGLFTSLALLAVLAFVRAGLRFWKDTHGSLGDLFSMAALRRATADALSMRYLGDSDYGCTYENNSKSGLRRFFHHCVFYGFMLDFAATTIAAFYEHILHRISPFPIDSAPVVLGSVGGVGLLVGTAGLLVLKWRSPPGFAVAKTMTMDVAFLLMLMITAASGFALLVMRESTAMGSLLVLHLSIVAGLFITLPYGKFAHVVFRYSALIKNAIEAKTIDEPAQRAARSESPGR